MTNGGELAIMKEQRMMDRGIDGQTHGIVGKTEMHFCTYNQKISVCYIFMKAQEAVDNAFEQTGLLFDSNSFAYEGAQ